MRSRAAPDLAGRCQRCWLPEAYCLCGEIPELPTRTEIVIVRHHGEARRPSGTARVASLALPRCRLLECGADLEPAQSELATLQDAWLLFPGSPTVPAGGPPARLVLLDGTWRQTRRMHRRLAPLWRLPQLSLPTLERTTLRLRLAHREGLRSTLEAVADALAQLESADLGDRLHALHQRFVERSLHARGAWTYRGIQGPS